MPDSLDRRDSDSAEADPDFADELELRDELPITCRERLVCVSTREAAVLIARIDALLDLDDEWSPASLH